MQGILAIYKPENYTSHDIVAIVRRRVGIKKVGHTGTLDPMARGVLVVCIGKATRIIEYLDADEKEYICTMKLGCTTDTLDVWGSILNEASKEDVKKITHDDIDKTVSRYRGEITQIPPKYSALKVKGKKLYEYARKGKEVVIKPRQVNIKELEILDISGEEISIKIKCSKGTYIRTLCDDIGRDLGVGGVMTSLIRTQNGIFSVDEAISIEDVKTMSKEDIEKHLKPIDYPLKMQSIRLDEKDAKFLIDGKVLKREKGYFLEAEGRKASCDNLAKKFRIYCKDVFIGIAKYEENEGTLKAEKIFIRRNDENI